jgi:hypothetical protein
MTSEQLKHAHIHGLLRLAAYLGVDVRPRRSEADGAFRRRLTKAIIRHRKRRR